MTAIQPAPAAKPKVTYKALNSEAVSAARRAAMAAGLSTEEWLTRAILDSANTSAAGAPEPAQPALNAALSQPVAPPLPGAAAAGADMTQRMEAMARHLQRAKAAADQAGVPVSEWLTRAIMDSARAQNIEAAAAAGARVGATEPAPRPAAQAAAQPTQRPAPQPAHQAQPAPSATPSPQRQQVPPKPENPPLFKEGAEPFDPLQERLARIVAARRRENARDGQQRSMPFDEQPMLLSMRPAHKGTRKKPLPKLDEPAYTGGSVSWFWTAVFLILLLFAGTIWALPYLPDAEASRMDAGATAARVEIAPQEKITGQQPAPAPRPASRRDTADAGAALAKVPPSAMPKPPEEYVEWYKRASAAGNYHAQVELAKLHIRGAGVERNPAEAARWLRSAALKGNLADAQYALGVMYDRGIGVERNIIDAALFYQRAADQGYVLAITQVGIAYLTGRGVDKDIEKAHRFLVRAAEAGEMNAQYTLGRAYEQGIGVKRDRIRALKWFILAAQRGHKLAAQKFENVSHKISDDERERANELAREHNERYKVSPN